MPSSPFSGGQAVAARAGGGAEGLGAEPGCSGMAKTQAGTKRAGLSRSPAIGIAAQVGCGSLKVFRAVW